MHKYWEDRLPYYVAGTLSSDERYALEQHLSECLLCQETLRDWQVVAKAVRDEAVNRVRVLPPLRVIGRVHKNGWHKPMEESIVSSFELTRNLELRRGSSSRTLSFFTVAAAALIVIVFAVLIMTAGGQPKNTGGEGDQSEAGLAAQGTPTLFVGPTLPPSITPMDPALFTPMPAASTRQYVIVEHVVQDGENCVTIAFSYGNTDPYAVDMIEAINQLRCEELGVGMKIWVPLAMDGSMATPTPMILPPSPVSEFPATPTPAVMPSLLPTGTPIDMPPQPAPAFAEATAIPANESVMADTVKPNVVREGETVWLPGIRYEQQGWNNQGPTALTMALSYYGWRNDQYTAVVQLKPNPEDKNVSPWQMTAYVNTSTSVNALYRMGGTVDLLKSLVEAGFPVITEIGFEPEGDQWMGHYWLVMGYNADELLVYDSFLGSNNGDGMPQPVSEFDEAWRQFNRTFIVVYDPGRENELREILGKYADPTFATEQALEQAQAEIAENNDDKWAWFNKGTALVAAGEYGQAAVAYDKAFDLELPFRMLWYQFGPFAAYYNVGRTDDLMNAIEVTLETTPDVEELHYWLGMALLQQGDEEEALKALRLALQYNANFFPAQAAIQYMESGVVLPPNVEPLSSALAGG